MCFLIISDYIFLVQQNIYEVLISSLLSRVLLTVDGGQRAVIFDRFAGVKDEVIGEGTHFLVPWLQKPILFDIRSTPRVISTITGSKGEPMLFWMSFLSSLNDSNAPFSFLFQPICISDLQNVSITLRILHRPDPAKLPNIYLNIGLDYAERVLPSITNEVLKAVVVSYMRLIAS